MLAIHALLNGEEGIWWCGQVSPNILICIWVQERLYCLVVRAGDLDLGGLGSNPGPMTSELCALTFL